VVRERGVSVSGAPSGAVSRHCYKWSAAVTAESIGTVRRIDADGDVIVSFGADAPTWRALAAEL
jgi:hypothetical protein